MSPFDYINDITYAKKGIMVDDIAEKEYNAFIINRGLSMYSDTIKESALLTLIGFKT